MLSALVFLPALALAGQSTAVAPAAELRAQAATYETALLGGFGVLGGEGVGGPALSFSLTHRLTFVKVGGELCGATALGGRMGGLGWLLGVHFGSAFSVSVLGTFGVHGYEAVGSGLLSDDPGADGSSAYAGVRLVLGYSFPRSRLFLGVKGVFDEDLDRQHKSVRYSQHDWFSGGSTEQVEEHTVGQTTWGTFLVVGREFDLVPY
jgi:hypothetical protein